MPKQETSAWLITHLYQQLMFDIDSGAASSVPPRNPHVLVARPTPISTAEGRSVWHVRRARLRSHVIGVDEFVILGDPKHFDIGCVNEMFSVEDPKEPNAADTSVVLGLRLGRRQATASSSFFPAYAFPTDGELCYRPLADVAAKAMLFHDRAGVLRLNTCYYGSATFFGADFLPDIPED